MSYKFKSVNDNTGDWPVLEEGDYEFAVKSCTFPMENERGYDVIRLELSVDGQRIWDNRSAGTGPKGEFDMISPFLIAINRIPKPGQDESPVFWANLEGAKGRCRLVQDEYKGKVRNKVAYYHSPKQLTVQVTDLRPPHHDPDDDLDMGAPADIPF